jgi:hypothetical protein
LRIQKHYDRRGASWKKHTPVLNEVQNSPLRPAAFGDFAESCTSSGFSALPQCVKSGFSPPLWFNFALQGGIAMWKQSTFS